MDWFLYDNGLRHERVNEIFLSACLIGLYYISGGFLVDALNLKLYAAFIQTFICFS